MVASSLGSSFRHGDEDEARDPAASQQSLCGLLVAEVGLFIIEVAGFVGFGDSDD